MDRGASSPKRVCVIGGGAAGMAAAWSLSRFPERYEVEVWEELPQPGGVATTCEVAKGLDLNDQVQGGAPSYRNNLLFFEEFGFKPQPLHMRISFGKGPTAWTNHTDSELVKRLQPEITRFGEVLRTISALEPIFIMVPINKVLALWGFSADFRNHMVFPLTALFFGTGNQTPNVAAAIVARVFLDPQLRLFDYSPTHLLNSVPEMFAFPKLRDIFAAIAENIPVKMRTDTAVAKVVRDSKGVTVTGKDGSEARFDDVIFACGAEVALRVIDKPDWLERRLLKNVTYYDDTIVTHEDRAYMDSHYDVSEERQDMYFIRTDATNPEKLEMSFNLSMYQPHLAGARSIFQSIFLDEAANRDLWTIDKIDPSKVLKTRKTRQFAHTWTHFAYWVPFVSMLQGRNRCWYAGAYTLINTHEIAVMSGLAAADRLGAPYPFGHDALAKSQYETYFKVVHGFWTRHAKPAPAPAAGEEKKQNVKENGAIAAPQANGKH